jgi:putative ABC transport system permease protein
MSVLKTIWNRIRLFKQRRTTKQEIDEELRFHMEQRTAENIAKGMPPEDAAREARKRFGNVQSVREECRETRGASFGEETWQDLRFACRQLIKNPGFTTVAVLTLALGIGANTAFFSVINAVLLRSLPYPETDRIVQVWTKQQSGMNSEINPSLPDFADFETQSHSFAHLAHYGLADFHFTATSEPAETRAVRVSTEFFNVLGVSPLLGRVFLPDESIPGKDREVVLSYDLWNRRFGGDSNILGRTIGLEGNSYVVCGVMGPSFHFPERAEIWVPYGMHSANVHLKRDDHFDAAIGRLSNGVSLSQASAEINGIAARLEQQYPNTNKGETALLVPLEEGLVGNFKPTLLLLLGAVGAVLLIACANVTSLQLTRSLERQKEIAIRSALGAGRRRIMRQLLVESVLLSTTGAAVGLLVAYGAIHALVALAPANVPRIEETRLDGVVLAACLSLSLLTGIFTGLLPAFQAGRINISNRLKDGSGATDGRERHFARNILVTGQITIAVVLLIAAGLLIKSFEKLNRVPLGFDPDSLVTTRISLPWMKYTFLEPGKWDRSGKDKIFFRQLMERIRSIPGMEHSALACAPPMAEHLVRVWVKRLGDDVPPGQEWTAGFDYVTPSYLEVMHIPLLRGRNLSEHDTSDSPRVVVVDEPFSQQYFGNEDPLGQQILVEGQGEQPFTIIGIAGGVRQRNLAEPQYPHLYLHYQQINEAKMWLVVRGTSKPQDIEKIVAREVQALDPDQSIGPVRTMEEYIADSSQMVRFRTFLLSLFALLAFALSAVGIYGLMAYSVSQRTRELGLRAALGASRRDILALIIGQGGKLAGMGVLMGIVISLGATRLLAGILFEVAPNDPAPLMVAAGLMFVTAILASYVPARRAAKVDPMVALRHE